MRSQIHDERIIQEGRKQNSLGFTILYYGLLLDLLYRQFILQEAISSYWDLALLFFGVTFIMAAKRVSSGLHPNKPNLKRNVPLSIIAAVVFSIFNYLWFGEKSVTMLMIGGIIFFLGFYGVILLMQYLSNKKNDDLLKD